jgi:diguanylate cyclase (GGDEF)-like protein
MTVAGGLLDNNNDKAGSNWFWRVARIFQCPEYIPVEFVIRLAIPLLVVFILGFVTNLLKTNLYVVAGLTVEVIVLFVSMFYFKLQRFYLLFFLAAVLSPATLVFFVGPVLPFSGIGWSFVAMFFLFVTLHHCYARYFSLLFIVAWMCGFYGAVEPGSAIDAVDVIRYGLTISIVSWALYSFMRGMEMQYQETRRLAAIDPLTGIYNRRTLNERLHEWCNYKQRYADEMVTLAMLDLDEFKVLNDRYGHEVGDEALCAFAAALSKRLRSVDILARYGGEEFVVLFPKTSMQQADSILEFVRLMIKDQPLSCGETLSFSAGLADLKTGESVHEWLRRADQAMYQAKSDGRCCNRFA